MGIELQQDRASDERVDELQRRLQSKIELKTGFGEPHQLSRELQRLFRSFDVDGTGSMSLDEFSKVFEVQGIGGTPNEIEALFQRYDASDDGLLTFAEFGDKVFGVKKSPLADPANRKMIARARNRILNRFPSVSAFTRGVERLDRDGSGTISRDEFVSGLTALNLKFSEDELGCLFHVFDADDSGTVSVNEFMHAVRGPLNARRKGLVLEAFALLDTDSSDTVTMDELKRVYDASQHPAVVDGKKTVDDVLADFAASWDRDGDRSVTLREFISYYLDVSMLIPQDDYFELMMRNTWHLHGGEGACANTSNLRVLVKHTDGRSTIVCVQNDLGLKRTDVGKIKQRLVKQGVTDIKSIQVTA
eukprot:TRINITY_DN27230_c0_g1_i1.p1 TRINITY_DN27230_c0_g1~~TRINITY_DN27230_c0_g1_i1.p1  ORF type:complete len:361 (+),score=132.76 TRINITY_DN27230_c0_g1_i1:52-1134(+)